MFLFMNRSLKSQKNATPGTNPSVYVGEVIEIRIIGQSTGALFPTPEAAYDSYKKKYGFEEKTVDELPGNICDLADALYRRSWG